jgi:hypothetical protein
MRCQTAGNREPDPGLLSAPNPTRAPAGHVTGGRLVIGGDVTVL